MRLRREAAMATGTVPEIFTRVDLITRYVSNETPAARAAVVIAVRTVAVYTNPRQTSPAGSLQDCYIFLNGKVKLRTGD